MEQDVLGFIGRRDFNLIRLCRLLVHHVEHMELRISLSEEGFRDLVRTAWLSVALLLQEVARSQEGRCCVFFRVEPILLNIFVAAA